MCELVQVMVVVVFVCISVNYGSCGMCDSVSYVGCGM